MGNKKMFGLHGENIACEYLLCNGYKIIHRNWTCRWGEIDIVAEKFKKCVFVEVKYRNDNLYGEPSQAINSKKIHSLQRSIQIYLLKEKVENISWQLDAICILNIKEGLKLIHYESVQ